MIGCCQCWGTIRAPMIPYSQVATVILVIVDVSFESSHLIGIQVIAD